MDQTLDEFKSLLNSSGNKKCADCRDSLVTCASVTFGVYLCDYCGKAHEALGGDIRRVSDGHLNNNIWPTSVISKMQSSGGNDIVNSKLEAELPIYFRRPWPGVSCPDFLREAFTKSKYIHEEFTSDATARGAQSQFACSYKSGSLLKKLRDSNTFCERFFELSIEGNYLRYFIKIGDPQPKQSLDLEKLNFTFVPPKEFDVPPHTALVQFVQDSSTRHMFLRSEDGRTIINWYNAIRLGKYHRLCLGLSGMGVSISTSSLSARLTKDLDTAGWLSKTGPRKNDAWRKRWCMLFGRHLLYTDQPLSAFAKGEIFIGSKSDGFKITNDTPEGWKKHNGFPFTIHTADRLFVFFADTQSEQMKWIELLQKVVEIPPTLDDIKQSALISNKRTSFLR